MLLCAAQEKSGPLFCSKSVPDRPGHTTNHTSCHKLLPTRLFQFQECNEGDGSTIKKFSVDTKATSQLARNTQIEVVVNVRKIIDPCEDSSLAFIVLIASSSGRLCKNKKASGNSEFPMDGCALRRFNSTFANSSSSATSTSISFSMICLPDAPGSWSVRLVALLTTQTNGEPTTSWNVFSRRTDVLRWTNPWELM